MGNVGFLLLKSRYLGSLVHQRFGSRAAVARLYHVGSKGLAEREGFEPPIPFQVCRFSRPEPSTTRPPLRLLQFYYSSRISDRICVSHPFEFNCLEASVKDCTAVFKTACFNHSHIPPRSIRFLVYIRALPPKALHAAYSFRSPNALEWNSITSGK
jgi:hypothetical protein